MSESNWGEPEPAPASMTVTISKGPRDPAESPETTILLSPSYLQRAATNPAAETLQVKVTVVPLHTSGPASLHRSTAAEAAEMMMASILYFCSDQFGSTS